MSSEKNSASLKTEQSDEVRKLQFKICSENEMLKFGTVAKELFPGAFIAMFGDLGAGKRHLCAASLLSFKLTILRVRRLPSFEVTEAPRFHSTILMLIDWKTLMNCLP